jgi:hypothetical protein
MAPQRLPVTRVAGIVAWTAASVAWGTALVATANAVPQAVEMAEGTDPDPIIVVEPDEQLALTPVPTMPEAGLVVLRYTPSEKPEARVVVRRVVVSSPSGGGTAPAAAPKKAPTKVKSAGS